jgi:hypothetical protein
MSVYGPMLSPRAAMNRRVILRFSFTDMVRGSHSTPPLAPPKGTSSTAHFQLIHVARAVTSSSSTLGWKRMPPLPGPRVSLCSTRKPRKRCT